jgi:manganese oxidase
MNPKFALNEKGLFASLCVTAAMLLAAAAGNVSAQTPTPSCERTVKADVVAFDQVFFYNRLGAVNPSGMIYALRRDVVPVDPSKGLVAGNVRLRDGKRPRPLVLRMNVGDCLQVLFQNLLAPTPVDNDQPATRTAGVHPVGLQLVTGITDDGSNVGTNPPSLVAPGGSTTYKFYAEKEGNHIFYSTAATTGGEGDGGSLAMGLFGAVNVNVRGAEWYRSQVTAQELQFANAGTNPNGTPKINYDAVYPVGHPRAGQPVLKMLDAANNIVHPDLNAIITGPNHGRFPPGTYRPNKTEPDREQPFREFTVIYHDEIQAVQAFDIFEDPVFEHTLHGVRDGFAINYGTGGLGAEILANRFRVGPMHDCPECLYEEFFLTTWAVGDPAMIVDVPANAKNSSGQLITGPKATKAFFPEDPSNVHHSYINDHVKFRVVHAGPKEHHIHHLHAHQWLTQPDDDNSTYLDSQALGPSFAFTKEINYNGSGNRNKVVGDSIFHCHFYPHFAQGMWELWRAHDVFESGTVLDADGRPAPGSRALPDGEIAKGTPIPAIVPVPTIPEPPLPEAQATIVNGQVQITGTGNPGFPFFVPARAGHRPPHPPLDTIDDGGLPRHIIVGGTFVEQHTRLDFDKSLVTAIAQAVPETGAAVELAAMNYHAIRNHPSFTPEGAPGNFVTNGLPQKPGAPYADPCIDDAGAAFGNPRLYKSANIQLDVKFNKAGWHFPQQRISTLWADVAPTLNGTRPPEPLFFRANSDDCVTFHLTNLTPRVYQQDDFQVKTPTDVMGQHIHLVKFDVTSSDGAGNGFNYEDGSFSPGEVQERIIAIRKQNNCTGKLSGDPRDGTFTCPTLKQHPFFGLAGRDVDANGIDDWLGAQTTVQRWLADNTLNNNLKDRTLRTVFTHDHFGPSTHQQIGLYAGLVTEPKGSTWRDSETGTIFGTRFDGGPTRFRADIIPPDQTQSYREFLLEIADFQLAYKPNNFFPDPPNAINPPARKEVGLPLLLAPPNVCPGGVAPPCPEAISADDVGTMVVNYRNEPIALRVRNPSTNTQATGDAGDLSFAFSSKTNRADPALNSQPGFYPALTGGVEGGDPFTPLLRAYENDRVQIRVLVGAHEEGHNFSIHGIKWFFEPGTPQDPAAINNSGYRNSQMMGISEHFEFLAPLVPIENQNPKNINTNPDLGGDAAQAPPSDGTDSILESGSTGSFSDHLYKAGSSVDDLWNGMWGLLRVYHTQQQNLLFLPNNPDVTGNIANKNQFTGPCPNTAPTRVFDVTAVTAAQALPGGKLVYNSRTNQGGALVDPTAILYVRSGDLDSAGKLKAGVPVEPLILRGNAGDCLVLSLKNNLPEPPPDLAGFNTLPMIVNNFNANQIKPSAQVGLHPQLVAFNVDNSDGANVGLNPVQTVRPNQTKVFRWYAGDLKLDANDNLIATPIEFGATNLSSSDPIKHSNKGAIGALIIEPQGSTWAEDAGARAQATVTAGTSSFREFVLMFQNDINMRFGNDNTAVPNLAEAEDPEDSGQKAFNYRTEPIWKRKGFAPDTPLTTTRTFDFTNVLTNGQVGGDPQTPVFTARAGQAVRFRVLHPGGHSRNNVFNLHGHIWQQEPYTNFSKNIGSNPLSEWKGSQSGHGPSNHFEAIPQHGAGGAFKITGDYLYRDQQSFTFDGGLWGIFRVTP